jgi:hypothetical protein
MKSLADALKRISAAHPGWLSSREVFPEDMPDSSFYRMLKVLQQSGAAEVVRMRYRANPERIKEVTQDPKILARLMWPGMYPSMLDVPVELTDAATDSAEMPPRRQPIRTASTPAVPAAEVQESQLELPAPPHIENLNMPPLGSPPELIHQWIFTLLHAQAENTIHMREKIDRIAEILEKLS